MTPLREPQNSKPPLSSWRPYSVNSGFYIIPHGARGGAVGWDTALQPTMSRVRFPMVSFEFFIDKIPPAALWPWGRRSL
jgi:hypothetical protein